MKYRPILPFSHFLNNGDKNWCKNEHLSIKLSQITLLVKLWTGILTTTCINQQAIIYVCIVNLWIIPILETIWHKYRPLRDPNSSKCLYFRYRPVNTYQLWNPTPVSLQSKSFVTEKAYKSTMGNTQNLQPTISLWAPHYRVNLFIYF